MRTVSTQGWRVRILRLYARADGLSANEGLSARRALSQTLVAEGQAAHCRIRWHDPACAARALPRPDGGHAAAHREHLVDLVNRCAALALGYECWRAG